MKHSIKELSLMNGMKGIFVDIPDTKVFACKLAFNSGHLFCQPDKPEIAHFMEHMVFKANKKYKDSAKLDFEFIKNGAYNNASTGNTRVVYLSTCPDFEWERILKLILLTVTSCQFFQKDFNTEKEVIREELTRRLTNYWLILSLSSDKVVHGYDLLPANRIKLLDNIKLEDLKEFYKKTHYPANLKFTIAGNLKDKSDQIVKILEESNFPNQGSKPIPQYKYKFKPISQPIVVIEKAVEKIYFDILFVRSRKPTITEDACMAIVKQILFWNGDGSIISGQARLKGLNYGVYGRVVQTEDSYIFGIDSEVEDKNASGLFAIIVNGLKTALSGDIPSELIERAKKSLTGTHYMQEPNCVRLSDYYSSAYFSFNDTERRDKMSEIIPTVDKEQINETLKSLFVDKRWYLNLLGANVDQYKDRLYGIISKVFD